MLVAYDELERDMNELKNNIGRRINPNDREAMSVWRERMRTTKERTLEDIELRASQLAEAAQRIRDRAFTGVRVIEIAPIAEGSVNNYDARPMRPEAIAQAGSANNYDAPPLRPEATAQAGNAVKKLSDETTKVEARSEGPEELKTGKIVKVKKENKKADEQKPSRRETKSKSNKSTRKPREASSTEETSEDDEPKVKRASKETHRKCKKNKSSSESEEDCNARKKRKKEKERWKKHKLKKRRKLKFATDDSSEREREPPEKIRKHKTKPESTSDGDDSESSESEVEKKLKSEKHRNSKHFKKWLILEKFDGTTPLSIFLNQLDTCEKYNGWDVEDKTSHLRVSLKGNAAYIIDDENLEGASYQKFIKRLKSRFGTDRQSSLYRS